MRTTSRQQPDGRPGRRPEEVVSTGPKHVLVYHVAVPLAIFAGLVAVGLPFGTAFVIGMMSGCVSMMLMMGRAAGTAHSPHDEPSDAERNLQS